MVRGVTVAEVRGRLDASSASRQLGETIASQIEAGNNRIVLDVSGIDYADSTGIEALVGIYQKAKGAAGGVRVVRPGAKLDQLLKMTRLNEVLGIVEDEESAVNQLLGTGS